MAYIVMAYIVIAYIVMAFIVMVYTMKAIDQVPCHVYVRAGVICACVHAYFRASGRKCDQTGQTAQTCATPADGTDMCH